MLRILIIFSIFLSTICSAQVVNLTTYIGHWENEEDRKSHMYITDKYVIDMYDQSVIDTSYYTISNIACDTSYKKLLPDNPATFLLETSFTTGYKYCYEVLSNGDNGVLTLRFVYNGYEAVFIRRKE